MFLKKGGLKNIARLTREHLCQSRFLKKLNLRHPKAFLEIQPNVFSCEFCGVFRNTFFVRQLRLNNRHEKDILFTIF